MWIGLNDVAAEGTYGWASGQAFSYTNWAGGNPNSSADPNYYDWVRMAADGRWYSDDYINTARPGISWATSKPSTSQ